MGNEASKQQHAIDANNNNNNNNKAKPKTPSKVLEDVEKFFEPAKEFFEPAKQYFDSLTDKRKELEKKWRLHNQRFIAKTKDGLNLRKKLGNTRIDLLDLEHYTPPVYEKTQEETLFLLEQLRKNFILNHLENTELWSLARAFEKIEYPPDQTIIQQGNKEANYFFIVYSGFCVFQVDGNDVGNCGYGGAFGELALLYSCPRAATVKTTVPTVCFRIDKKSFRYLIMSQKQRAATDKIELLRKVPFLKDLQTNQLERLSSAMQLKSYKKGDYIAKKGDPMDRCFDMLYKGQVKITDIAVHDEMHVENLTRGPGEFWGERTLMAKEGELEPTRVANIIALTEAVSIYSIDADTVQTVLGDISHLIGRSRDKLILESVDCIKNTFLESSTLEILTGLMEDQTFSAGTYIMQEGEVTEPAFYIIRSGKCQQSTKDGTSNQTLAVFSPFGFDHLTMDVGKPKLLIQADLIIFAAYSIKAIEDTICGVLKLKDMRTVFDTSRIGQGKAALTRKSIFEESSLTLSDVTRHTILGQGSFGQVWLVSIAKDSSKQNQKGAATAAAAAAATVDDRLPFALKIQSKYDLIQSGQVDGVINELQIMSQLQHPFLLPLVKTFQDMDLVYMLLGIVQGGELSLRIYSTANGVLPEKDARFYAAGIVEALSFMHQKHIIHRDLKPENILVDSQGYPVIIDFGFAKHVPDKTYTFCGTPLYIAPEIILNRGHNAAADHWSLGCIIFEMVVGRTPFYEEGMEAMDLYKAICTGKFPIQPLVPHKQILDLITKLFVVKFSQRLGSLARGQMDILRHAWFYEIDFALLRRKELKAPWVPQVKNVLDASNFTDCSHLTDKTKEKKPALKEKDQEKFELFGVL